MDVRLEFEGERAVLSALATSERYARAGLRRAANRAASRLRTRTGLASRGSFCSPRRAASRSSADRKVQRPDFVTCSVR